MCVDEGEFTNALPAYSLEDNLFCDEGEELMYAALDNMHCKLHDLALGGDRDAEELDRARRVRGLIALLFRPSVRRRVAIQRLPVELVRMVAEMTVSLREEEREEEETDYDEDEGEDDEEEDDEDDDEEEDEDEDEDDDEDEDEDDYTDFEGDYFEDDYFDDDEEDTDDFEEDNDNQEDN